MPADLMGNERIFREREGEGGPHRANVTLPFDSWGFPILPHVCRSLLFRDPKRLVVSLICRRQMSDSVRRKKSEAATRQRFR